jgi:hypothetical protein
MACDDELFYDAARVSNCIAVTGSQVDDELETV